MRVFSFLIILSLFSIVHAYGQEYFEGEIQFKITYDSKSIPVEYFVKELGDSFTAYVKEDRYVMQYHGTGELGWTKIIVRLDEGYTYTEFEKNDTIRKSKFGSEKNNLLTIRRNTETKKVLGENCESVTIYYQILDKTSPFKSVKGTYYFNPKYKLNPEQYKNYTDGFWNLYAKEAESLSLRNETEFYPLFKFVQEAVFVEEKEIPLKVFELNKRKVIVEK